MRNRIRWVVALGMFGLAAGLRAQEPTEKTTQRGENPFNNAEMREYWNPQVGSGEEYEITGADGKKRTEEYDILSEQTVDGKKAYWLEIVFGMPGLKGKAYAKALVTPADYRARKVIGQLPGMAAMDMPTGAPPDVPKADPKKAAKLLGTEAVTVPGGTFECEHYREADGSEVWLSAKVGPMKVVKSTSESSTRVLVRTVSHPKDGVTGPVKPYDPDAIKRFVESQSQ